MTDNTDPKGLGSKAVRPNRRGTIPRVVPTPPPVTPVAPAAPSGTSASASTPPPPARHARHGGGARPVRAAHAVPPVTAPAPAAPADPDAPAPSEDDEKTADTPETEEQMRERLRKELEEENAKKTLRGRLKKRFSGAKEKGKKTGKKLLIFAFIGLFIYFMIQACNPFGLAEDSPSGSGGSGIGESTVSRGIKPKSGQRAAQSFPDLSVDGDNKVLNFEDPTAPSSLKMTFQVTVDEDNTITKVDLSPNMLKYGFVKFGTTNKSDKPAGYCREESCDFTDTPVNLCKTWMFEQRQIPAAGGSEFEAHFWSAREYDQAMTDDSSEQVYPGDSGGSSRLCGGKY